MESAETPKQEYTPTGDMLDHPTDPNVSKERLEKLLAEPNPDSWQPEQEGETLYATFLRWEQGPTGEYGSAAICVCVEIPSGEKRSVWLFHTALISKFETAALAPGEAFVLRWNGKKVSASGRKYDDYDLRVDRGSGGGLTLQEALAGTRGQAASGARGGVPGDPGPSHAPPRTDDDIPF